MSTTLDETIQVLRNTINTTNAQLTECSEHNSSVQNDLDTCNAKTAECEEKLTAAEKDVEDRDATIEGLQSDVLDLTEDAAACQKDLDDLRCSVNKFLPSVIEAENRVKDALIKIEQDIDDDVDKINGFAGGQNLKCNTCSEDAPCIQLEDAPGGTIL